MGSWSSKPQLGMKPDASVESIAKQLEVSNRLGFAMLEEVGSQTICSSLSVYLVLSMCICLCIDDTKSEIRDALGFSECDDKEIVTRIRNIIAHEESSTLSMYNQVVIDPSYRGAISLDESVAHDLPIVEWKMEQPAKSRVNEAVKRVTHGMIDNLLDSIPPGVKTLLVNAIYFEGKWKKPFKSLRKQPWYCADGSKKMVDMMIVGPEPMRFRDSAECMTVVIPYQDDHYMVILVPKPGMPPLTYDFFMSQLPTSTRTMKLIMPKWEVKCGIDKKLESAIKSFGITKVFSTSVGFSIDSIVQKARIIVDETGTKAAAATYTMSIPKGGHRPSYPIVCVDKPFYYAIVNEKLGVIEFLGHLDLPNGAIEMTE